MTIVTKKIWVQHLFKKSAHQLTLRLCPTIYSVASALLALLALVGLTLCIFEVLAAFTYPALGCGCQVNRGLRALGFADIINGLASQL
jgi:hypothetical protein